MSEEEIGLPRDVPISLPCEAVFILSASTGNQPEITSIQLRPNMSLTAWQIEEIYGPQCNVAP
ncbi:hypothetical protein RJ639_011931 [Escallonia herrerae]|uniref:Uncharacterized protein n=1 Tax=Escallonia herrerae TaxID=1293975 RepID=A0AA89AQ76_9ASTE|nr:hypothetical protein RJ639_011931 [Escallonia herrerae]